MEPDCSLPTQGDTPELEPAPAETEDQCQDRFFFSFSLSSGSSRLRVVGLFLT